MGFQYAKVVSFPGEPKLEDFTAFTTHSKMERTGFFECSNQDLNQLAHNILWGLKGNFVDVLQTVPSVTSVWDGPETRRSSAARHAS